VRVGGEVCEWVFVLHACVGVMRQSAAPVFFSGRTMHTALVRPTKQKEEEKGRTLEGGGGGVPPGALAAAAGGRGATRRDLPGRPRGASVRWAVVRVVEAAAAAAPGGREAGGERACISAWEKEPRRSLVCWLAAALLTDPQFKTLSCAPHSRPFAPTTRAPFHLYFSPFVIAASLWPTMVVRDTQLGGHCTGSQGCPLLARGVAPANARGGQATVRSPPKCPPPQPPAAPAQALAAEREQQVYASASSVVEAAPSEGRGPRLDGENAHQFHLLCALEKNREAELGAPLFAPHSTLPHAHGPLPTPTQPARA